jgi:hypothetical protein
MSEMVGKLSIQNVRLKEWIILLSDNFDVDDDSLGSYRKQGYRSCVGSKICELQVDGQTVYEHSFAYKVGLRFIDEADEELHEDDVDAMLVMEATFESIYHSAEKIEDKAISDFSAHNVGFNVWPFWRELVQTSSARLGLPENISVPFYQSEDV